MKKIVIALFMWLLFVFMPLQTVFSSNAWTKVISQIWEDKSWDLSATSIKDFISNIATKAVMPIMIFVWLLIAFLGFYKLSFSDKEDDRKRWTNYVLWGTIGVVIMSSAWFLVHNLVWGSWWRWLLWVAWWQSDPAWIARALYKNVLKKFFVLAMYLVVWILFVVLLINLIRFLGSWDKEDVKKHSKTIVVRNSMWIILILFARNLIEMFYWKFGSWASSLWDGWAILQTKNLSWIATVVNYVLWFLAFIITWFIIYQAFLLLTKPDDEATYKSLKRYFVYAILWVFLIWWVYIIANFFIVQ